MLYGARVLLRPVTVADAAFLGTPDPEADRLTGTQWPPEGFDLTSATFWI